MESPVYIYVDNSNLWIEGKKVAGEVQSPPLPSNYLYRIEYGKLLDHVRDGRRLGDVPKLYGSEPPPNDSVWRVIEAKGFDVSVFKRNIFNKEKGVDMKMGLDIQRRFFTTKPAGTVAIVAGDADFVPVVEEARDSEWTVEVWYWSNCAGDLKAMVGSHFHELDSDVYEVGFDQR